MYRYKTTSLNSTSDQLYRYLSLTKPRIIVLLSLTGIVAYLAPSTGIVRWFDILVFVTIGFLTAGGAMAVNNYIDRDIDILMQRTANRSSVGKNAIMPLNVLVFGSSLAITGLILGYLHFGIFTLIHLAWGVLFYIFGYSLVLKRKSILNTIIGGLASPAPVFAGYAARAEIAGSAEMATFLGVPIEGWLLGGLVFLWTPSHTWALSAKNIDDYSQANIPMLPVKLGLEKTGLLTLVFGGLTICYGFLLITIVEITAIFNYLMILPSLIFVISLLTFARKSSVKSAKSCFKHHNIWLATYFVLLLLIR